MVSYQETNNKKQEVQHSHSPNNFKLPKLNLIKFDVSPDTWIQFWAQFENIHIDSNIKPSDKFRYLQQSLIEDTKAFNIVKSYPPLQANYEICIDHLIRRFGKDELVIQAAVNKLLKLVTGEIELKFCELVDYLGQNVRTLKALGVGTEKYELFLYPLLEKCLPKVILELWVKHKQDAMSDIDGSVSNLHLTYNINNLMAFLEASLESQEHVDQIKQGKSLTVKEPTAVSLVTHVQTDKLKCPFCPELHKGEDCDGWRKMSLDERKQLLYKNRHCLKCLKRFHYAKVCRTNVTCKQCGSTNHTEVLCFAKGAENKSNADKVSVGSAASVANNDTSTLCSLSDCTYLQTLYVYIITPDGPVPARALLDTASQRSYVTKATIEKVGTKPLRTIAISQAVFGGGKLPTQQKAIYELTIKGINSPGKYNITAVEQVVICNNVPTIMNKTLVSELKNNGIKVTDIDQPGSIDLLLGADCAAHIMTGNRFVTSMGPVAYETTLGWTLMGKVEEAETGNTETISSLCLLTISDMWSLQALGIEDPIEQKDKAVVHEELLQTFYNNLDIVDKRYSTRLLWKEVHPPLKNNLVLAEKRLEATTRKLKHLGVISTYSKIFEEWLEQGIIEEVPDNELITEDAFYLPHRAVIKESSKTTKVRPVFDGSAKGPNGVSINDCLETGPNLLQLLYKVLLRFRNGNIGVTSDIVKAFLQIIIQPVDRNFLRFLWWDPKDSLKVKVYRHCRVIFGINSSPFVLNASLKNLTYNRTKGFEFAAKKLQKDLYVDDFVTTVKTPAEFQQLKTESTQLLATRKFELAEWKSSCFGHTEDECEEVNVSVLGMSWHPHKDELSCKLKEITWHGLSKRNVLSIVQSVFDPLGITSPAVISLKILLQEIWKRGIGWDCVLPTDIHNKITTWMKHYDLLKECSVPRNLCLSGQSTLHIFCDASQSAYATCAFVKGSEGVRLVMAQNRVAPLTNKINIPRLELLGALIASRLYQNLQIEGIICEKTVMWTDSMVVLNWLYKPDSWKPFVTNRIKEILSYTDISWWRHVPGTFNAAGLPSRGCTPEELLHSGWINGPQWLLLPSEQWPNEPMRLCEEAELERKIDTTTVVTTENAFLENINYFSQYSKIVRTAGWLIRFIHNCRNINEKTTGDLSTEEIKRAEDVVIRYTQQNLVGSKALANLQVFQDENGILRIQTKLLAGTVDTAFRTPILLAGGDEIVKKMIFQEHRTACHAGVGTLLSKLREKWWITKGRQTCKKVIDKCLTCKKLRAQKAMPPFAPLPKERTNLGKCFENTGCDLIGPIISRNEEKVWIVLFTCAVYRAVHFETVDSLSSEAFIRALRRFIARKGRCLCLITDNGSNFIGTENMLKDDKIYQFCTTRRIRWLKNPPSSPWYGGFFERLVRSTKDLLKRNLGNARINREELDTLLCDIEVVINSRPLTYQSEDPDDLTAITPTMFFQDLSNNEVNDLDEIDEKGLSQHLRYVQKIRESLRQRFQSEYLSTLINKGKRKHKELQIGELVLVESDNVKRVVWPLGRIVELYPGRDGVRRVALVKTAHGVLKRPLQRLFPLEIALTEQVSPDSTSPTEDSRTEDDNCSDRSEVSTDNEFEDTSEKQSVSTRVGRIIRKPTRFDL